MSSDETKYIHEELSADEWKESILYNDDEVNEILKKILLDFEIDVSKKNIELLEKMIYNLISDYEDKYDKKLDEETRKMLRNLVTKMSYDKLCIKQYV